MNTIIAAIVGAVVAAVMGWLAGRNSKSKAGLKEAHRVDMAKEKTRHEVETQDDTALVDRISRKP